MHSIEANAEDCVTYDTFYEILTTPENFESARQYFESNNIPMDNAELDLIPANYIKLEADKLKSFLKLIDELEDNDDIQEVYHNVELPEDDEE